MSYNLVVMINGFGVWLREKRKARDWTQEELGKKAGISISYVSTLERNQPHSITGTELRPALDKVDAIARALGVPLAEARLAAGYAPPITAEQVRTLANQLAEKVMAAGLDDLQDEELREAFMRDMQTIAESMLKGRLQEQEKRRGAKDK
jgi:transcriptional regulator with XRE-family HTH domain